MQRDLAIGGVDLAAIADTINPSAIAAGVVAGLAIGLLLGFLFPSWLAPMMGPLGGGFTAGFLASGDLRIAARHGIPASVASGLGMLLVAAVVVGVPSGINPTAMFLGVLMLGTIGGVGGVFGGMIHSRYERWVPKSIRDRG